MSILHQIKRSWVRFKANIYHNNIYGDIMNAFPQIYSHLRYPRRGIIFFQIPLLYREITAQRLVHAKRVR